VKVAFFVKHSLLAILIAGLLTQNLYVGIFHACIYLVITVILQLIQMKLKPDHYNIVKKYSFLILIVSVWSLNFVLNSFEAYRELTVLNRHGVIMNDERYYQEEAFDGNLYVLYEGGIMGDIPSALKLKRSMTGNYVENWQDVTKVGHDGTITVLVDYVDEVIIVFGSKNSKVDQVEFKQMDGDMFILNLEAVNSDYYTFTYHFRDIDYNDKYYPKFIENE
jgi:hypothetical protein